MGTICHKVILVSCDEVGRILQSEGQSSEEIATENYGSAAVAVVS